MGVRVPPSAPETATAFVLDGRSASTSTFASGNLSWARDAAAGLAEDAPLELLAAPIN
jgi:hypothetical protein